MSLNQPAKRRQLFVAALVCRDSDRRALFVLKGGSESVLCRLCRDMEAASGGTEKDAGGVSGLWAPTDSTEISAGGESGVFVSETVVDDEGFDEAVAAAGRASPGLTAFDCGFVSPGGPSGPRSIFHVKRGDLLGAAKAALESADLFVGLPEARPSAPGTV